MIPTNLAAAIAAIQNGDFGLIETVKIGDILVSSLTDFDGVNELIVTERPVEAGLEIARVARTVPLTRTLTICLANPDFSVEAGLTAAMSGSVASFLSTWRDKKNLLNAYLTTRELVTLQTHEAVYDNMLVQRIEPIYSVDENWDAFFATVTLQQVTLVQDVLSGLFDKALDSLGGL